jgi:hypothetical protein
VIRAVYTNKYFIFKQRKYLRKIILKGEFYERVDFGSQEVVDDEPDILTVVEGEISESCPNSTIDKATQLRRSNRPTEIEGV